MCQEDGLSLSRKDDHSSQHIWIAIWQSGQHTILEPKMIPDFISPAGMPKILLPFWILHKDSSTIHIYTSHQQFNQVFLLSIGIQLVNMIPDILFLVPPQQSLTYISMNWCNSQSLLNQTTCAFGLHCLLWDRFLLCSWVVKSQLFLSKFISNKHHFYQA